MFLDKSREQESIGEKTDVHPTTTAAANSENNELAEVGMTVLDVVILVAVAAVLFIICKRKSVDREKDEEIEKTTERKGEEWSTLPTSTSKKMMNPLRKVAAAMNVEPNPEKAVIGLFLGDPTITGKLPPSQTTLDALNETLLSHKHDGYAASVGELAARQAVVDRYSTPEAMFTPDDVILASGCAHALQMTIETVADSGDNILIPQPGFPRYSTYCQSYNIEDRSYNLDIGNDGLIDLDHLESLIDQRTKAIIVNNPGNPTGVVFPREHLEAILELAERYRLIIIADEVYGDLVYDGAVFYPLATLSPKVPVICCDGIAKRWMVPGWRLGWVIVHDRHGVLAEVRKGLVALSLKTIGPCSLVQGALPKMLRETPDEYFESNRRLVSSNANIIFDILKCVRGLRLLKPHGAMYLMIGIDEALYGDDITFVRKLTQEESVIVMPGTAFSAPGWIRLVIVHSNEVMTEAAHRMRRYCQRQVADANPTNGHDSFDENCN